MPAAAVFLTFVELPCLGDEPDWAGLRFLVTVENGALSFETRSSACEGTEADGALLATTRPGSWVPAAMPAAAAPAAAPAAAEAAADGAAEGAAPMPMLPSGRWLPEGEYPILPEVGS